VFVFCRPLRARAMTHRTCSMRQGFQGALKDARLPFVHKNQS
jgi:hypothetical protein